MLAESLASIDCIDSIDSVESLEPIESIESIESVESVESVESIISIEPIESVESIESCRDCKVYIRATQKTANIHTTHKGKTTVPMGRARSARPIGTVVCAREARAPFVCGVNVGGLLCGTNRPYSLYKTL